MNTINFSIHYYTVRMNAYRLDKLIFSNWTQFKIKDIFDVPSDGTGRDLRVILQSRGPASHADKKYLAQILGGEEYIKSGIFV